MDKLFLQLQALIIRVYPFHWLGAWLLITINNGAQENERGFEGQR